MRWQGHAMWAREAAGRLREITGDGAFLRWINLPSPWPPSMRGMPPVLYRCSTTGKNVQVWYADDVPEDTVYVSLRCPACARVHLVNRRGRTLHAAARREWGRIAGFARLEFPKSKRRHVPGASLNIGPLRRVHPFSKLDSAMFLGKGQNRLLPFAKAPPRGGLHWLAPV